MIHYPPGDGRNRHDPKRHACPLCGSTGIRFHHHISHDSHPFDVDRCSDCGFIFMNPPFKDEVIEQFYRREYYEGSAEYSYFDERGSEPYSRYVWNARLKTIRKYVPTGKLLDIGCAFGGFLSAASTWFEPYGIELSPYSAEHAQKRLQSPVHCGTIHDHPFKHGSFDVITMVEVIEHVKDPLPLVQECRNLLREGGLLLVQTSNMDGLQAKCAGKDYAYYLPGHLSYFSRSNLTGALMDSGFKGVRAFQPVDFGLMPKLKKSRMNFQSTMDYLQWFRIGWYHYRSKIHLGDFALTSSMVLYAFT